jgi:trimeric autotransporter adhesin
MIRKSELLGTLSLVYLAIAVSTLTFGQVAQTPVQPDPSSLGVPHLVKYSGLLKDASGDLLNGTVGATFAIYSTQNGGVPLWTETQNVFCSQGRYTVSLGSGTIAGIPTELFSSGQSRWLGVRILSPGEEESSRIFLTSVPYALKAADADTVGGLPASAFARAGASVPGPGNAVGIEQSPSVSPNTSSTVTTPGGTANSVPKFSSATVIENSNISDTGSLITLAVPVNVTGSSLMAPNVNNFLYAANFSGSDIGAQINSALAACPAAYGGVNGCTIVLPQSNNLTWSTPVTISGADISLLGYGSRDSVFNCTANSVCLTITNTSNFTVEKGSSFSGFRLNGNSGSNAVGIQLIDYQSGFFQDIALYNFTGTSAAGLWLTDQSWWTEGNTFIGIDSRNNTKDYRFTVASGDAYSSFGYNRFLDLRCEVLTSETCFSVENNATIYNGTLRLSVSKDASSNGAVVINTQASAVVGPEELHLTGEDQDSSCTGTSCGYLFNIGAGTTLNYWGEVFWGGSTPSNIVGTFTVSPGSLIENSAGTAPVGGLATAWSTTTYEGETMYCPTLQIPCTLDFQNWVTIGSDSGNGFYINTRNGTANAGLQRLHIDNAGNVVIPGSLSVQGTKNFKIDHPLDPANKYLVHASVESSEMMNIYTGNLTTDAQGEATVQLPDWFEALNTDFRYQLTVVGQFAQAIIERKVENHQFTIKTNVPDVEVSWQVTAVRHDAYAKAHPLRVEQEKDVSLKGFNNRP